MRWVKNLNAEKTEKKSPQMIWWDRERKGKKEKWSCYSWYLVTLRCPQTSVSELMLSSINLGEKKWIQFKDEDIEEGKHQIETKERNWRCEEKNIFHYYTERFKLGIICGHSLLSVTATHQLQSFVSHAIHLASLDHNAWIKMGTIACRSMPQIKCRDSADGDLPLNLDRPIGIKQRVQKCR